MERIAHFFFSGRKLGRVLWCLIVAATITLFLAGIMTLITGAFLQNCVGIFFLFTAPCVAAAILVVFTPLKDGLEYGFGCGLYYGTIATYALLDWLYPGIPEKALTLIGIIITSLVCYLVYLKRFKD